MRNFTNDHRVLRLTVARAVYASVLLTVVSGSPIELQLREPVVVEPRICDPNCMWCALSSLFFSRVL